MRGGLELAWELGFRPVVLEAVLHPLFLTASLEKSWVSRIFGDLLCLYRTQLLTRRKQLQRLPSILVPGF